MNYFSLRVAGALVLAAGLTATATTQMKTPDVVPTAQAPGIVPAGFGEAVDRDLIAPGGHAAVHQMEGRELRVGHDRRDQRGRPGASDLVAVAIYQDRVPLHEALCTSHAGHVADGLLHDLHRVPSGAVADGGADRGDACFAFGFNPPSGVPAGTWLGFL